MTRALYRRLVVTLAALAWLLGAAWHGSMEVQAALAQTGSEICTSHGVKRIPAGDPASPAKSVQSDCQMCAAFSAPGAASAQHNGPQATAAPHFFTPAPSGAVFPSAHLADLASRAPPAR